VRSWCAVRRSVTRCLPALAAAAAVVSGAGSLTRAAPAPSLPRLDWILAASHFQQITANPLDAALFRAGTVYEPVSARQRPSTAVHVVAVAVFHSYAALVLAYRHRAVNPLTRAVLYDNERFPDTPKVEQADPGRYDALVAAFARARHWTAICDFILPDRLAPEDRTAAREVPPCSVIGLNTVQQSERSPAVYRAKVAALVAVVRRVRGPSVPVLAGLSSNPAGPPVTASVLAADMRAVAGLVNGFWLNVPAPGVGCPRCGAPRPAVLSNALALFARAEGGRAPTGAP
jgi:hypothetical protein